MDLDALVVVVVSKKGLQVLPAIEFSNDDTSLGGHTSSGILGLSITPKISLHMGRLELATMQSDLALWVDDGARKVKSRADALRKADGSPKVSTRQLTSLTRYPYRERRDESCCIAPSRPPSSSFGI